MIKIYLPLNDVIDQYLVRMGVYIKWELAQIEKTSRCLRIVLTVADKEDIRIDKGLTYAKKKEFIEDFSL